MRAIEAPSDALNAGELRCVYDGTGRCTRVNRWDTPETVGDDCLERTEERAWSSGLRRLDVLKAISWRNREMAVASWVRPSSESTTACRATRESALQPRRA